MSLLGQLSFFLVKFCSSIGKVYLICTLLISLKDRTLSIVEDIVHSVHLGHALLVTLVCSLSNLKISCRCLYSSLLYLVAFLSACSGSINFSSASFDLVANSATGVSVRNVDAVSFCYVYRKLTGWPVVKVNPGKGVWAIRQARYITTRSVV